MLFFEDEARFGRMGECRKSWVPRQARAIVPKQQVREYVYALTAVCPETGETSSIISPLCNIEAMEAFLDETSEVYKHYRILMVMDGASWHTSTKLRTPENIEVMHLPPYSPELNPVEHIWDYIREQKRFANYSFTSLDEVEDQLVKALREIDAEKEKMKSMCNFKWLYDYS